MTATIRRLRTRADQLRSERADQLRQLLEDAPDLPSQACSEILAALDQLDPTADGWAFVMLSPAQNHAVVSWLRRNSHAPLVALDVWALLFTAMVWKTGEIVLTRDEIADQVGTTPTTVTRIMRELESIGAIITKREKTPGRRGPAPARFFMSPNVATNLTGPARTRAQAKAPKVAPELTVVDGGQA